MFWKSAPTVNNKRMWPLTRRLVVISLLSGSAISLLSAALILPVAYFHLTRTSRTSLARIADDLVEEYQEFGLGQKFYDCMEDDAEEHDTEKMFLFLTTAGGAKVYTTKVPRLIEERVLSSIQRGAHRTRMYLQRSSESDEHVALWLATRALGDGHFVTVARDVTATERFFFFLSIALGAAFLLTTLLATILSWIFGSRLTRRLNQIGETARKIEAGDWSVRTASDTSVKELYALATLFNAMCEQNEKTLTELKMITDNLAHDLRTPLTRLRMAAESGDELGDRVMDETGAMLGLINTMLEISQTPSAVERLPREDLKMNALVEESIELFQPLAAENGIEMAKKVPREEVIFRGHKHKIQQVLGNLIENAIKYTPRGGHIEVGLEAARDGIKLWVADTGCGIGAADLAHVFQRFWRADASRHLPGNGLGLSLVEAIAKSYHGQVDVQSEVGKGTTFTIFLRA